MLIGQLAGFLLGIAASIAAWVLIAKTFLPRFEVSKICRDDAPPGAPVRYRVKIVNLSKRRDIVDVSITVRLVLQGLVPGKPENSTFFYLPVGDGHPFPVIEARNGRVYVLHPNKIEDEHKRLPADVKKKLLLRRLDLQDVLKLDSRPIVRIAVTGAHPIGGLRRTKSLVFDVTDIEIGDFVSRQSIKIIRNVSHKALS